jgi:hypothetical protein
VIYFIEVLESITLTHGGWGFGFVVCRVLMVWTEL